VRTFPAQRWKALARAASASSAGAAAPAGRAGPARGGECPAHISRASVALTAEPARGRLASMRALRSWKTNSSQRSSQSDRWKLTRRVRLVRGEGRGVST
jgi:hypothetical protein